MTRFERIYHATRAFDHPLYQSVYKQLSALQRASAAPLRVLDVGGRRSNYTIGLSSRVTISDVPRERDIQHQLDLGATDAIRGAVLARRSNVADYVYDDMTRTALDPASFDAVVAVEVLEHVEEDAAFVRNVAKVLKPNGAFIMTTPNGDFLPTPYPDHKRHYKRDQLAAVLRQSFPDVDVRYVVNSGALIRWGVYRPSLRNPVRTGVSVASLFLSARLESAGVGGQGPDRKRHLLAVARKRQGEMRIA